MEQLLIVGCGDIGLRVARLLAGRMRMIALTSSPQRAGLLRAHGITPIVGNLDDAHSLRRLSGLCDRVLYLAPVAAELGSEINARPDVHSRDARCLNFCKAVLSGRAPKRLVYISTTGVYAPAGQEWIDETTPALPATQRGKKRLAAERVMRWFGRVSDTQVSILRVPGIYALDRAGGNPAERLRGAVPFTVIEPRDDVYSQHIHADDLARLCVKLLFGGGPQRVFNAVDDSDIKMGDYFDLAADLAGLPRPGRLSRKEAAKIMSPILLSFMSESRRIQNTRIKTELQFRFSYPTVNEGLAGLTSKL